VQEEVLGETVLLAPKVERRKILQHTMQIKEATPFGVEQEDRKESRKAVPPEGTVSEN
jgi:hypothetical protein